MDMRTSAKPWVAGARRRLERINQRRPWDHNAHFHGWILRNLPARREAALDVGCGTGALAERLAPRFGHVTGVDADEGMAAAAAARLAADPRVTIVRSRIEEFAPAVRDRGFDLVTMVAVLHHLDLDGALAAVPRLLSPGGRLLVVGLAQVSSATDVAIDCVSAVANPVVGLVKHPRRARPGGGRSDGGPAMPVKDPATSCRDVAAAARVHLPGATVRRRLFFRYTLRWDEPG